MSAVGAPLLRVRHLSVSLGGVRAVQNFDIDIEPGDSVAMFGPNGAGKTTVFNAITRFVRCSPDSSIEWRGQRVEKSKPFQLARSGLVRTFQNTAGVRDLNVVSNLLAASRGRDDLVEEIIGMLGLESVQGAELATCGLATRKLVSIGMALVCSPELLLLDEPLAGLDPRDRGGVMSALQRVHASGVAIFLIEHDIGRAMDFCSRVVVLDNGKKVFDDVSDAARKRGVLWASQTGTN